LRGTSGYAAAIFGAGNWDVKSRPASRLASVTFIP